MLLMGCTILLDAYLNWPIMDLNVNIVIGLIWRIRAGVSNSVPGEPQPCIV